jgi:hypothetical protein
MQEIPSRMAIIEALIVGDGPGMLVLVERKEY